MSVICINCEGWGCMQCSYDRAAAAGGEQGLTADELKLQQLRTDLGEFRAALVDAAVIVKLFADDDRHAAANRALAKTIEANIMRLLEVPS
jgi:hypothetical protein